MKNIATESDHQEYQDWLNGISDKNTQRDFNKGMLEADKELQKVCEACKFKKALSKINAIKTYPNVFNFLGIVYLQKPF